MKEYDLIAKEDNKKMKGRIFALTSTRAGKLAACLCLCLLAACFGRLAVADREFKTMVAMTTLVPLMVTWAWSFIGSMSVGTKEVLFGYHNMLLHPALVLLAWRRLFGNLPKDIRIWIAIAIHDIGYFGARDIDGEEGTRHPELGGRIMEKLFGKEWGDFTRGHSGNYAELFNIPKSRLYAADKLAGALLPDIMHTILLGASGGLEECAANFPSRSAYRQVCRRKAVEHRRDDFKRLAQLPGTDHGATLPAGQVNAR